MHLSRLLLRPLSREVRRDLADCHEMHRTLLRCFPQAADPARQEHGVLYRLEMAPNAFPRLLVQSRTAPHWAALPGGYLTDIAPDDNPATAPLDRLLDSVREQAAYRFRLVANPTRDISVPQPDGRKLEKRVELRGEQAWYEWLERKGALHGFKPLRHAAKPEVLNTTASAGGKLSGKRQGAELTIAVVRFDGLLEVTDRDRFRQALGSGIGRSRAYGCGLLSVAAV